MRKCARCHLVSATKVVNVQLLCQLLCFLLRCMSRDHTPCWRWVDPSDLLHDSAWGCLTAQDDFGPTPGPSASVGWPNSIGNLTIRDPDTEDYGPEFTSPISGEKYTLVVQALLYLHTQPT